jgi:hypothetical protein
MKGYEARKEGLREASGETKFPVLGTTSCGFL